jgi:two-component system response regulator YesN
MALEDIAKGKGSNGKIHILIVDDEDDILTIAQGCMDMVPRNYEADYARDGAEAIEKLQRQDYHLVISDIEMPLVNGFQLYDWVKENRKSLAKNFIAMSSFGYYKNQAISKGMGFMPKPIDVASFGSLVRRMTEDVH